MQDTKFWQEKMRFSRSSQTLFSASVHGDATLATQAVRSLGDPNCCSGTGLRALQVAISCGNSELVGLLLKAISAAIGVVAVAVVATIATAAATTLSAS